MLLWLLLSLWQIGAYPLTEGDDEALGVLMGFRLASVFDNPIAFGSPFIQGRPPLSYLPTTIGAHLFPVNEFTLRLPYALIGALQMPLLLALTNRAFGRRAAAFAGVMLLGTGLFAINRLTLGTGVFMTLELAGALLLLRYVASSDRRWLILSAMSLAAATLTFLDGAVLLAAVISFAWWKHRNRQDMGIAILSSVGVLVAFAVLSLIASNIYSNGVYADGVLVERGIFTHFTNRISGIGLPDSGFFGSWLVYVGVPIVLLLLIGLAEAIIHRRSHRTAVILLLGLAAVHALPWLFLEPRLEHLVFTVPLVLAVAGFGWAQLLRQLDSIAAQSMVAMAVAAIAMAGVVWQQAVFNPDTEFTASLSELREYALSLDHGHGLFDGDTSGIKAVAHVLREETEPDDRIFVRDGVSAAAVRLYAARSVESLELGRFSDSEFSLDGTFLVIEGEDETFNAGLSGSTTVVANHRIYDEGEVLYQIVEFSEAGEPFTTPIWWRSDVHSERLFREHTAYTDYLRPLRTRE